MQQSIRARAVNAQGRTGTKGLANGGASPGGVVSRSNHNI